MKITSMMDVYVHLTWHIAIARHVSIAIISNVAVDPLVQGTKRGYVWIWILVYDNNLNRSFIKKLLEWNIRLTLNMMTIHVMTNITTMHTTRAMSS